MPQESQTSLATRSVAYLPFDVLFELSEHLSGKDIAYFLSTCKVLHAHMQESLLWQKLVARYGIRDITYFRGRTFYDIYTQLLWPYGALIGLWASDRPFMGKVVEFRLLAGSADNEGGIVCDVWQFSQPEFGEHGPSQPRYRPLVKLTFDDYPLSNDAVDGASPRIRIACYPKFPEAARLDPENAMGTREHPSTIKLFQPYNSSFFVQSYRRTIPHPDFPVPDAPWYDEARGRPRLIPASSTALDQRPLVGIYPAVRLPIIFSTPAGRVKPTALSFICGKSACTAMHEVPIPFDDIMSEPPRYYPLRAITRPGVDPRSPEWTVRTLEGLWLGDFGISGTEVLFLSWHDTEQELRASKITGDAHVPRGAVSWKLHAKGDVHELRTLLLDPWLQRHPTVEGISCGTGTISERGFHNSADVDLIIGATGPDEIQIWWDKVSDMRTYIRYKGRDEGEH